MNNSLSVILPMLNEEEAIVPVITQLKNKLHEHQIDYQLIVVDDGSTDTSYDLAHKLLDQRMVILRHDRPKGIGACYREALKYVCKENVTWMPTDGEFTSDELVKVFLAIGPEIVPVAVPMNAQETRAFYRRALSKLFLLIVTKLFHLDIGYTNAMAIYPTGFIKQQKIISSGFTVPLELLILAQRSGYKLKSVLVKLNFRQGGKAKALRVKSIVNVLSQTWRLFRAYR